MKKIILAALLVGGLASSAFAQLVSPTVSADIILGFRDSTGASNQNLMLNLGTAAQLTGGGSHLIVNLTDSGTFGASSIDSIFGAGWNTNANLKWAAVGTVNVSDTTNPNGVKNTLFATKGANSSLLDGNAVTTGFATASNTTQNNGSTNITTMYTNFGSGAFRQAANTATGAWTKQEGSIATAGFGYFNSISILENSTNITGSYVASDLWQMNPTNGGGDGQKVFLGTLALFANGDLTFTAFQAIPEPSTYAALLGVATLGVVAIRRRRQAALENV